jgi:hypothetical protein
MFGCQNIKKHQTKTFKRRQACGYVVFEGITSQRVKGQVKAI